MEKLRILLIEDDVLDAELATRAIKGAGINHENVRVDNIQDLQQQLEVFRPDVILSDYNLPTCNAIDAFEVAGNRIPFIILSGAIGEEKAVEALKMGVTDYVSKDGMSRLPFVIDRATKEHRVREEKHRAEQELVENKERLELALTGAELGTWDWDIKTNKVIYNKRAADIFGHPYSDLEEDLKGFYDKIHPNSLQAGIRALKSHYMGKSPFFECELMIKDPENSWRWVLAKGKIIKHDPDEDSLRASGTVQDIDQRKTQQEKLVRSQQLLHEAHQIARIGSFEWTIEEGFTHCSEVYLEIFEETSNKKLPNDFYFNCIHPEDRDFVFSIFFKHRSGIQTFDLEHRLLLKSGNIKVIRSKGQISFDDNEHIIRVVGTLIDITEQHETKKVLYRGQELERQRVAREIHDGIGQMLIATKYKVSSLGNSRNGKFEDSVEEVEDFLDNVIEETRRITRNLSNKMVEEFGLSKALSLLIDELSKISGVNISCKIEEVEDLSHEISVAIYRIIQEAINNATKYAEASQIAVTLERNKMSLLLKIKDNGNGFDVKRLNISKGSGLKNMKDRTSALNGHFELISSKEDGTEIISWLPLTT